MEEPKYYVSLKTVKRLKRSKIIPHLTCLEITVRTWDKKGWESWFDSYIKSNCWMAYKCILAWFEYWALKLLKDKVSRGVRNTGNDLNAGMVQIWNNHTRSHEENTGNITPEDRNSRLHISTSYIQLYSLNTVSPTPASRVGVSVVNENH